MYIEMCVNGCIGMFMSYRSSSVRSPLPFSVFGGCVLHYINGVLQTVCVCVFVLLITMTIVLVYYITR